jgi:hypothetical protein
LVTKLVTRSRLNYERERTKEHGVVSRSHFTAQVQRSVVS